MSQSRHTRICACVCTYVCKWCIPHSVQLYLFTSRHVQIGHLLAPLPHKEVVQSPAGEVGAEGYAEVAQVRAVPVWDGTGDDTAESDKTYAWYILGESMDVRTYKSCLHANM